jgi:hypothetical protein
MMHVQLRDRILASCTNVWFDRRFPSQGSILGETPEINRAVAFTSRLLNDDREGCQSLQRTSHKLTIHSKDNEPRKAFGVTFNTSRNLLQQAFRTQSHIGWDNFLKGRISRDWLTYVRHNEEHSNGHGESKDWSAKFIGGLWEHLKRLWQFRNDIYHQDYEGTIERYKLRALERDIEKLWARHT